MGNVLSKTNKKKINKSLVFLILIWKNRFFIRNSTKEDGMYAIIEDEAGSLFYKEVIVDLSATVEKSGLLVLETIYINEENKYFDLKESDYIKDIKKQYGYLNWLF